MNLKDTKIHIVIKYKTVKLKWTLEIKNPISNPTRNKQKSRKHTIIGKVFEKS